MDAERSLKTDALTIYHKAMEKISVSDAMARQIRMEGQTLILGEEQVNLSPFDNIFVVSLGKAAWEMLHHLLDILGDNHTPSRGVVVSNVPSREVPRGFASFQGGHPHPDAGSVAAADATMELLAEADSGTVVIFLISGGGSALLEKPLHPQVSLGDLVELNRILVGCGAPIGDINTVRKHFSAVKGGRLALKAAPAHMISILISDVPENQLASIASGPTLPNPSTTDDVRNTLEKFDLLDLLPPSIRNALDEGIDETPKPGNSAFDGSTEFLLLSSVDALEAARKEAEALGYLCLCDMECDEWALPDAAGHLLEQLGQLGKSHPAQPVAIVSAGEILCPVTGRGRGGRNQAFVLHCVEQIAEQDRAVLSAGTDGIDGNSPAAGAVADGDSFHQAGEKGLNPGRAFEEADSYTFFDALGDAIVTGPRQNNVRDLRILLEG